MRRKVGGKRGPVLCDYFHIYIYTDREKHRTDRYIHTDREANNHYSLTAFCCSFLHFYLIYLCLERKTSRKNE